jgi:hypothetical protein
MALAGPETTLMKTTDSERRTSGTFFDNLPARFSFSDDPVERLLLREYGAVFAARGVRVPEKIVFKGPEDVRAFQSGMTVATATIGGHEMRLQEPAMAALQASIQEAEAAGLSITPRGVDSAARDYEGTVELWASRVEPGLKHWVAAGRMTEAEASRILAMSPFEQVPEVLRLEEKGIYFAKDLSKSIIYSVAPPGTSQHLSLLAFDVKEFADEKVRAILAKHHWYQTVASDLPHFTFLGVEEGNLPSLGLKRISSGGQVFWLPDV